MGSRITGFAIDCRDAESLAAFWCAALDYTIVKRFTDAYGLTYVEAGQDGEPVLVFQPVPEHKAGKNRLHLDLHADGPQIDEVARLVATAQSDNPGLEWIVLQDPEGYLSV